MAWPSSARCRLIALWAFTLLVLWTYSAFSGHEPQRKAKPARAEKPYTVTYDVSDLIYRPGGKAGYDSIDALLEAFMPVLAEDGAKAGTFTVHEVNGRALEVHTARALHEEVKDLLTAMRRLADVAVDVAATLVETDRTFYEKELLPKFTNGEAGPSNVIFAPVNEDLAQELWKHSTAVRSNKTRIADGREARFFSMRKAFTYSGDPWREKLHAPQGLREQSRVGMQGITCQAKVDVSPDRRFVRMRIAQHISELVGMIKREVRNPRDPEKQITAESPRMVKTSVAATIEVEDEKLVLVPVRYLPPDVKVKDRMLILLVRPQIYIEEEQKERGVNLLLG